MNEPNNTNLTTTITSEEYRALLWRASTAINLAEAVAADWLATTDYGFNKPSDATLKALRDFDHELFFGTERAIREAERKEAEKRKETPPIHGEIKPGKGNSVPAYIPSYEMPFVPPIGPNDVPQITITCEAQGGGAE